MYTWSDPGRALRRNEALVTLLKDVSIQLNDENRHQVTTALENLDNEVPPISPWSAHRTTSKRPKSSLSSSDIDGDSNSFNIIEDETLCPQNSGGPGYIGSNSVIRWLQSLQREIGQPQGEHLRQSSEACTYNTDTEDGQITAHDERHFRTADGGSITNYYFYLDEDNIDTELHDCHIIPLEDTVIWLFGFYEKAIQTPFPILCKAFKGQLHTHYKNLRDGNNFTVCDKWKATLNLVCVIGARYAYLTSADLQRDSNDHLIYMRKAVSLLEMHHSMALISCPDLALIQVCSLLVLHDLRLIDNGNWSSLTLFSRHRPRKQVRFPLLDFPLASL